MNNIFNLEKILTFFNYVFWFLTLNLIFMLVNIPTVLFLIFIGISKVTTYLPLFLVCLIPFAASFTTLLYCMGKIIRNKDINVLSDFIHGFKSNFKNSTIIWIGELVLVFILYTNVNFFSKVQNNLIFSSLFIGIFLILILITPYIFLLISRFSMDIKSIIKSSLILLFTRPLITIANVLCFVFTLILFELAASTTVLFMSSITAFLIMFSSQALLKELEEKAKKSV